MAILRLDKSKLINNFNFLNKELTKAGITWGVVTKMLCGDKNFLNEILSLRPQQVCDSRVKNLRAIKQIDSSIETVYIKPPPKRSIASIVKYADISFNTELNTIKLLSEAAKKLNKTHKIVIMIELGDLREGVLGETLIDFYSQVFCLDGIKVIGIGANLNCLNGVMPSQDKLIQLALYKSLLEAKFDQSLDIVSGGSTVTLPLLSQHQLPKDINHFRIGEALYFGVNLFTGETFPGMDSEVFQLHCEIIELTEKPFTPIGELSSNPNGDKFEMEGSDYKKTGLRCIVDVGLLDIDPKFMTPMDSDIKILGSSSDMMVMEISENRKAYRVGDVVKFKLEYMGVLSLMNSKYIDKEVISGSAKTELTLVSKKVGL